MTVSVYETIGSQNCILPRDGEKVYKKIVEELKQKREVTLSFEKISLITSAFLNVAIGKLYDKDLNKDLNEKLLDTHLKFEHMGDNEQILNTVVENAKRFYKDPDGFSKMIRKVLDEA